VSTSTFQAKFDQWLDGAMSEPIPSSVVAFSFNLAEPWCIEVIGSDRYSDDDPDWACEESFRPNVDHLGLPESEVGETWEAVLEAAKRFVAAYLDRSSAGSTILRRAEAVAVGFVDGESDRVWPRQ
jgi:shikimate kinase